MQPNKACCDCIPVAEPASTPTHNVSVTFQPVQGFPDPSLSNNNQTEPYRKSSTIVRSSLCPNLSRKSSVSNDDANQGYLINYSTLPHMKSSHVTITSSPMKYATLPRPTAQQSPLRGSRSASGSASQASTPCGSGANTPVPSPRMGKRGLGGLGSQKPGAIDNTPLIAPNTTRVRMLRGEKRPCGSITI